MSTGGKRAVKKTITWSKERVQQFLELFQQQPCLYETRHAFYANKHARAEALDSIRLQLNIPDLTIDDVKTKINNIRSQMSQELKKKREERSGMGADDKNEHVWWFEEAQFLLPHMKTRQGRDSLESIPVAHTESTEVTDDDENNSVRSNVPNERVPVTSVQDGKGTKRQRQDSEQNEHLLSTLKALKESVHELGKEGLPEQEFANYIAKELASIDDSEINLDCKHAINNIIYEYKKKFLQKKMELTNKIIE
nr:uncharacterized protein LOC111422726 [Onthophagus taurus]